MNDPDNLKHTTGAKYGQSPVVIKRTTPPPAKITKAMIEEMKEVNESIRAHERSIAYPRHATNYKNEPRPDQVIIVSSRVFAGLLELAKDGLK